MDLTPEERLLRDQYLFAHRLPRLASHSFELILVVISIAGFSYGLTKKEDDAGWLVMGYVLGLLAVGRYLYGSLVYGPHLRSLIAKYEAALAEKRKMPNQAPEPTAPSGRGSS